MSRGTVAEIDLSVCTERFDRFGILGKPGVSGLYLGSVAGMALIEMSFDIVDAITTPGYSPLVPLPAPSGETLVIPVLPGHLVELGPVISSVSYIEFMAGYSDGVDASELGMPISTRLMGRKPTDHGRGFGVAADDAKKRILRHTDWAYNEYVRKACKSHPDEHWYRYPCSPADKVLALGFRVKEAAA